MFKLCYSNAFFLPIGDKFRNLNTNFRYFSLYLHSKTISNQLNSLEYGNKKR